MISAMEDLNIFGWSFKLLIGSNITVSSRVLMFISSLHIVVKYIYMLNAHVRNTKTGVYSKGGRH